MMAVVVVVLDAASATEATISIATTTKTAMVTTFIFMGTPPSAVRIAVLLPNELVYTTTVRRIPRYRSLTAPLLNV